MNAVINLIFNPIRYLDKFSDFKSSKLIWPVQVFGKNDITAEKREKIRQRNKMYASDQFLTFNRHKSARDKIYKEKIRQETEMLRRTKTE